MPLGLPALQSGLRSTFAQPPATTAGCAQAWADAVKTYAVGIVPPSAAVDAATATLAGGLQTAFAAADAAPGMETAFAAFAASLGGGMAGFAPVPPPGQVGFASQFSGAKPSTHDAAATAIASRIDTWLRTGLSNLIAPPNTVTPWT